MPSPEECNKLKVAQAVQEQRLDAVSERLDEVLDEIRGAKAFLAKWLSIWFPVIILLAILGNNAMPIILKLLDLPAP